MTNHSLPIDPSGSEGDSERKKWGYKRQQFDAVISTTRFNGAVDNLVNGTVEVGALLAIIDELNVSTQRGRYMAEVLALKQESRCLATAPFGERVAEFLVEGSRRIPWLSDGLASQLVVALASAADNPAYLDTVNTAVGNLLLDLDRPLRPETRNFLRALTDKIEATRRLHDARGYLATVPSVYPPVIPEQLANAKSPEPPSVETSDRAPGLQTESDVPDAGVDAEVTGQVGQEQVLAVGEADSSSDDEYLEPAAIKPGPKYTTQRTLMMPAAETPPTQATTPNEELGVLEGAVTALADAVALPEPAPGVAKVSVPPRPADSAGRSSAGKVASSAPPPAPSERAKAARLAASALGPSKTAPGLGASPSERPAATTLQRQAEDDIASVRIPTSRIPIWIVVLAVGGVVAGGLGIWLLTRGTGPSEEAPAASASSVTSAVASAVTGKPAGVRPRPAPAEPAAIPAPPAVAPSPTPPPVAVAPQRKLPKASSAPVVRTPPPPAPKSVYMAAPPRVPKPVTPKSQPVAPQPKAVVAAPTPEPPAVPHPPKPSRTIDDILVDLLQVPNDPASIEAKAHEVARIVARSARADAEHILQRLIPEEVLAGTETVDTRALEPVRRVVALLLMKVALDKDDNRAAMAIDSLGEWAKSRKHGAAAKLTLDQLAEEPVILSRPKRLRAIERVQARLGISNVGE